MKNELIKLKNLANNCAQAREEFNRERENFNAAIDANINDERLVEYTNQYGDDAYLMAVNFVDCNSDLVMEAKELRKKYPDIEDGRFISMLAKTVMGEEIDPRDEFFETILDSIKIYLLLEKTDFEKVFTMGEKLKDMTEELDKSTSDMTLKIEGTIVDTGKKIVSGVGNVIRPYGEVAKEQLGVVSKKAKKAVNRGSKQLVKLFQEIDKKTSE